MKKIIYFIIGIIILTHLSGVASADLNCETVLSNEAIPIQIVLHEPLTEKEVPDKVLLCYQGIASEEKDGKMQIVPSYYSDYTICRQTSTGALHSIGINEESNKETAYIKAQIACPRVQIIVGDKPLDVVSYYIQQIYTWAASIIGIIAVGVIAVSGIQIATSQGENIDAAKGRILQALAAIALLFLSGLFLYTINPDFFIAT